VLGSLKSFISTYAQWFWMGAVFSSLGGMYLRIQQGNFWSKLMFWRKSQATLHIEDKERKDSISLANLSLVTLTLVSFLVSVYIIMQALWLLDLNAAGFYGVQKQPFTSSAILLLSSFVSLYLINDLKLYERSLNNEILDFLLSKVFSIVVFVATVSSVLLLGQRSTIIGFALGMLVYFIFGRMGDIKNLGITILGLVAGAGIAQWLSPRFAKKLSKLLHLSQSKSLNCRFEIWDQNLKSFGSSIKNSLFGADIIPLECMKQNLTHMHNIYLQQLVGLGVFAFVTWLSFYIIAFWQMLRNIDTRGYAFISAFIALSVEGFFENWWGDSEVLTVFLFVVVVAVTGKQKS